MHKYITFKYVFAQLFTDFLQICYKIPLCHTSLGKLCWPKESIYIEGLFGKEGIGSTPLFWLFEDPRSASRENSPCSSLMWLSKFSRSFWTFSCFSSSFLVSISMEKNIFKFDAIYYYDALCIFALLGTYQIFNTNLLWLL